MFERQLESDDGELLDCWGRFVSKRTIPVGDERVVVFKLRVGEELVPFVLGPAHTPNSIGWGVGDVIEIRSALMCRSTGQHISVGDCPSCGGDIRRPVALSEVPISDSVFSALNEIEDERFLLAIPGTVPIEGDTTELCHRGATVRRPDWLTIPDPVCQSCGRTLESQNVR